MHEERVQKSGYWCIVCFKLIEPDDDGLIIHDEIPHPSHMMFDEEDRPQ